MGTKWTTRQKAIFFKSNLSFDIVKTNSSRIRGVFQHAEPAIVDMGGPRTVMPLIVLIDEVDSVVQGERITIDGDKYHVNGVHNRYDGLKELSLERLK